MSNFKVGDWVRNRIHIDEKHMVFDKIEATNEGFEFLYFSNNKMGLLQDYEPWQPKEGEWCWSKYDGLVQILKITDERYIVFPLSTSEKDCTIEYRLGGLEPFIGELPSFLKDKQ